jgi:hypothetical protein
MGTFAKPVSPFSGNRTPQARSGCAEEPPAIDRKPELARLFGAAWRCDVGLPHHDPRIVPISCSDHHTARADAHVEGRTTDVDHGLRGGGFAGEKRVKPRSPEFCGWWICTKSCPFEASHERGAQPRAAARAIGMTASHPACRSRCEVTATVQRLSITSSTSRQDPAGTGPTSNACQMLRT